MSKTLILTPVKHPPEPELIIGLSSLGQLILGSLSIYGSSSKEQQYKQAVPNFRRDDPVAYYKEVYYKQFQADPEAHPGSTQPYPSKIVNDDRPELETDSVQVLAKTKKQIAERRGTEEMKWLFSGDVEQEMRPKQLKTNSNSNYAPTFISSSQVDVARNGGMVHSPVLAATPSNLDNISDCVPQQQNITFPWREIQTGEFIFTGDYLADNNENGYKYCNPVTNVEHQFETVNVQNNTRVHSRFKFQDRKEKVKKKMMTRIVHTISCEKENVDITGQELTPEDHYLDITGQELTPQNHLMTVDHCQDYPCTSRHGVSDAVEQYQDYPSISIRGVSDAVDQFQDYPSTSRHGVSDAVDQCQDYPFTSRHGVRDAVDQCQDHPSTSRHGVGDAVDQYQDHRSTSSHGVSDAVDQYQDYPSTSGRGVSDAVDQCQDYCSTFSHGVSDAVDQCQDYPSTSRHGVSDAVDQCQEYTCTSRLGVCDAQKVKVVNESTFGCPLFNISFSPILDSSPVCESLSHSVPERYANITVAPDVFTSNIFEKDESYFINIKEKETCAEYIIDSNSYESAFAPQESVVNCQLHAQKEFDLVTDDAQKESGCVLHNEGKEECAYLMENVGKGERFNPKTSVDVVVDIGYSLGDDFVSREFPNRGNELCNIPMIAVSENSGKVESRDSKVCSTCSVELCRSNADIDLKHEFALHVSSSLESQLNRGKILNETVPMELGTTNKSENIAPRYAKEHGKRDTNNQQNISYPYSGKPVFKIPFRKIPKSPICSYPLNGKHITSTPKDVCQDNIKKKDFHKQGKGYSLGCKSATVTTSGKEGEEVYTHPHSSRQGSHLSVKHVCFRPETTMNKCNETPVSKKKQILKQRFIQKSSNFKIPSLRSEVNQKDRSQQLQIANNAAKLSCEEEQHHVELEPKGTTHSTFISQACRKQNFLEKIPYGSSDNSVLKGHDDFTLENVQNGTYIDINPFKVEGISTGNIGLKEKLKKLSLLPLRVGDNAPDKIQSKSMIFSFMSKEVAEKGEESLETAEKDSHYFRKILQIKESNDNNINSMQELHTGLKRNNVRMSVKECWKRNESKKRKTTDEKSDLKKSRKKSFCEEKVLLRETDSRTNKTQKGSEQKKEPKPKDRKMKLKKQKEKSCEGKKSTAVRLKTANWCGTEGKNTEKLRERKTLGLIDKMLSSSDVTQVSYPQHVLGCDANLFAIREYITAATEICFTLFYRDGSTQLRERVSGSMQHPGIGQVTGFAVRIMWRPDAAPPAHLLPQQHLVNGIAPHAHLLPQEALVCEIPHITDHMLSQDTRTLPLQDNHSSFPTNNQQKNIFRMNDPEVARCGYAVESQNVTTVKLVAPDKERKYAEEIAVVYKLSADTNNNKEKVRSLIGSIMTNQVRKICFDAQESIAYLVKKFEVDHKQAIGSWVILDPKVGGWLLNPERPPITFKETALLLQAPLLQVSCGHQDDQLYCDLEALSHVTHILHARLCQHQLWTIFLHLEMRVMPILAVMELRGIRVDREVLKQTGQMLKLKIQEVEKRCHEVSGSVFNVTSYSQLRTVLYQELKLDVKNGVNVPCTARGQKSTSEVALGRLIGCHPLPALVLRHRLLSKLKTTYVDGIMACLQGSYIKANWEQTSACTGRIQCCNPNLQSIPKQPVTVMMDDTETVVLAREFFCSRDGYVLVSADFQQMELRVLAHLSQDAMLQAGFKQSRQPIDIFKQLSSLWLEKDVCEVTPSERERTKRVVYAVIYGAGQEKLVEVLQISPPEAMDIITSFIRHFPSIPTYMRSVVDLCKAQGFLTTLFSRRRFFPRITSHDPAIQAHTERQAVNFVLQGSVADISKAAMVQTGVALASRQDIDASLLIHIHDELVWEVRSEHVDEFIDMVRTIMEDTRRLCGPFVKFRVPLPVTICTGFNWAHMHPWTHF